MIDYKNNGFKNKDVDLQVAIKDEENRVRAIVENYKQSLSEFQLGLSKYEKELVGYQADVTTEIQSSRETSQRISIDMQKRSLEYQWLIDQYNRLKVEYDQAFGIMRPSRNRPNRDNRDNRGQARQGGQNRRRQS